MKQHPTKWEGLSTSYLSNRGQTEKYVNNSEYNKEQGIQSINGFKFWKDTSLKNKFNDQQIHEKLKMLNIFSPQ